MERLTRRDFLRGAAAVAAAGLAVPAPASGPDRPEVEQRSFELPGLDPAHDGLRVAQLSDVHVGPNTPAERIRAAVASANGFRPDLVVLTGDYLSRERSGVGLLREQLGGLTAPTVAVLGNHDHWVDARGAAGALEGHGYSVLKNQHTTLSLRGAPFTVVGIDDLVTRNADPVRALAGAPRGSRLVLAHAPRTADLLARLGEPALCLSGHTHGGQIALPILTRLFWGLARERYLRGLFRLGAVQLYVNRGIGSSYLALRVGSPPEVTLATLRAA